MTNEELIEQGRQEERKRIVDMLFVGLQEYESAAIEKIEYYDQVWLYQGLIDAISGEKHEWPKWELDL